MYISELESIKFRTNKKGICILCRACIGKLFVQNNLLVYLNWSPMVQPHFSPRVQRFKTCNQSDRNRSRTRGRRKRDEGCDAMQARGSRRAYGQRMGLLSQMTRLVVAVENWIPIGASTSGSTTVRKAKTGQKTCHQKFGMAFEEIRVNLHGVGMSSQEREWWDHVQERGARWRRQMSTLASRTVSRRWSAGRMQYSHHQSPQLGVRIETDFLKGMMGPIQWHHPGLRHLTHQHSSLIQRELTTDSQSIPVRLVYYHLPFLTITHDSLSPLVSAVVSFWVFRFWLNSFLHLVHISVSHHVRCSSRSWTCAIFECLIIGEVH